MNKLHLSFVTLIALLIVLATARPISSQPILQAAAATLSPTQPAPKILSITLVRHTAAVNAVAWSPNGKTLASAGGDKTVRYWNASNHALRRTLKTAGVASSLAWSPNGKTLAVGESDYTVEVWNASGEKVAAYQLAQKTGASILSVSWSPDGAYVVAGTGDKTGEPHHAIYLLDASTGEQAALLVDKIESAAGLKFLPDGKTIGGGSVDSSVYLWDYTGAVLKQFSLDQGTYPGAWSPDGKTLATVGSALNLWTVDGTKLDTTFPGLTGDIWAAAWSPDGSMIAAGLRDYSIRIFKMDGTPVTTLRGHAGFISSLDWSPDGAILASASYDRVVRMWMVSRLLPGASAQ